MHLIVPAYHHFLDCLRTNHPQYATPPEKAAGFFPLNPLRCRSFSTGPGNSVSDFVPGQRWVNYAELQLGLGTVLSVELRTVTLVFMAIGETRTYSMQSAPLTRVLFAPGDTIRSHEGWSLEVERVAEQDGLLTYVGSCENRQNTELPEGQLDSHLQLNRPAERLFTGQVDHDRWFELRYQTLQHVNRLVHSDLRGLTGGRTALIPHQLYIAHEVANRFAPRVLLADEVGLGKTIEAGLILHQQLLTERARRILIVVPESLLHQWLVEMLRRFNLAFSIFDEARCQGITESSGQENPFHAEQQVLCTLEFLGQHPERHQQAVAGDWDLLVVDEAHHLQWSPEHASPEYRLIEALAQQTRGVLLLTATPEQLGKESHFARLRLLDPDRFHDFAAFVAEEKSYEPVAAAVEALLDEQVLDANDSKRLRTLLDEQEDQLLLDTVQDPDADRRQQAAARTQLVELLLDRHGTGRVLFRNTRSAIKGFPGRQLHSYPLPVPDAYAQALKAAPDDTPPLLLLCPELLYQAVSDTAGTHWTQLDPRVDWLSQQLRRLRPDKVLVITANAETAMDLAEWMHSRKGIHAAVFHEGLSIIERDRAAAYFADMDYGTQVLVCSEIGSEGRNFQFAHHLILFDLPLNPDLLEQRIGRLDRIGQTETIQIHVPWLEHTAQAVMQQWYHEGLEAFEHICPAGQTVFTTLEDALLETIRRPEGLTALIAQSRELNQSLNAALHRGRDRLLEYNSCRPAAANAIKSRAEALDSDTHLFGYLEQICDCYGIDMEPHTTGSHILQPGEHMHIGSFPGLPDEGMTFTCDRAIALANEDRSFISWEHPLITGATDLVLSSETGNCAMSTIKHKAARPGTLLLECLYTLDTVSSDVLQTRRYLPPGTIRIVTDQRGTDHSESLTHALINSIREPIRADTAIRIIRGYTGLLRDMLDASEALAGSQTPALLATAHEQSRQLLGNEIHRLEVLSRVNPNVRKEETEFLELQQEAVAAALDSATLRLDALRVLVAT
jgi:ATP-dependent helicase HepA